MEKLQSLLLKKVRKKMKYNYEVEVDHAIGNMTKPEISWVPCVVKAKYLSGRLLVETCDGKVYDYCDPASVRKI